MNIVILDFETAGLEPHHPSIQLAAIAVDEAWNEVASFERKIKFDVKAAQPDALALNHYTDEAWADAVLPDEVFAQFVTWLKPYMGVDMTSKRTGRPYRVAKLAAYNASFDLPRLWTMADGSFVPCHPQGLCILQLAMWCRHMGRLKCDDLKLGTVAKALGIDIDGAHEALADVRMAAEVAKRLAFWLR